MQYFVFSHICYFLFRVISIIYIKNKNKTYGRSDRCDEEKEEEEEEKEGGRR